MNILIYCVQRTLERLFRKTWRKIRIRGMHPGLNLHHIRLAWLPAKAIDNLERDWYDIFPCVRVRHYEAAGNRGKRRPIRPSDCIVWNKLEEYFSVGS